MSFPVATKAAASSGIDQSTRVISALPQRKSRVARLIPPEVWSQYAEKIKKLYVTDRLSLKKLKERMFKDHLFDASTKQWKHYLAKSNLRKNLTCTDAGLILRLYHEAQDRGRFVRRVKFWDRYKSLVKIQQYVRKSPGVRTEAELLKKVMHLAEYPEYITWKDSPSAGSHPPETPPPDVQQVDGDIAIHMPDCLPSPSSIDDASEPANDPIDSIGLSDSDEPILVNHRDAPETDGIRGARDHGVAAAPPATGSLDFDALVIPFVPYYEFEPAMYPDSSFWHNQLSITPILEYPCPALQSGTGSWPADDFVSRALGSNHEVKDACSTGCIKAFLRHCCEAMFHHNRQDDQSSELAVDAAVQFELAVDQAVQSYNHIIVRHLEWSLTTLNNMLFLLQLYGQKLLAEKILTGIHAGLRLPGGPDFAIARAIARTIAFKIHMPNPNEMPNFDLEMLRGIRDELAQNSAPESPLFLTAQYNLAWASLEMTGLIEIPQPSQNPALEETRHSREQERDQALQEPRYILEGIRSACERTFGPFQIQTITCMATLARVYLTPKQGIMAELLINDVATRVEQSFSRTHPLYWELKNRQALFTLTLAKWNVRPDRTNEYWRRGENLLRDVLVWRASDSGLGPSNPQTARTINVLKHWLKQQSKLTEAENVSEWLDEKLNASD